MADGVARVPLPDGKIYHFNIIYNHARSSISDTPDTRESRAFTEQVVGTLENLGFVNCYYYDRDALPGRNVFNELFRVVEGSDYTIVILTHGFVRDCWRRYTQMSAFKTLLDRGRSHKFIPIAIGLNETDLPQELNTEHVLFFAIDWERDANAWNKLKRVFVENRPVPVLDRDQDLYIVDAVEETNALHGAQPDEFDGDGTESRALDNSIQRPNLPCQSPTIAARPDGANTVGQVGTGQGLGGDGRHGVTSRGQNVSNVPNDSSEVSVGRASMAHRDETGGEATNRQAENAGYSGLDRPDDVRQSENDTIHSRDSQDATYTDPAESEEDFTWNAEFYNNGGNYESVSMNLERRQFVSNPTMDLQRRPGVGASPATAQPRQNTQRDDRGNVDTDGTISLPGSSLRLDGGDIETSVVNRLESRGGLEYRRELFDETTKKSIDGVQDSRHEAGSPSIDIKQTKKKLTADMPSATVSDIPSTENIPPNNDQSSHTPSDVHPDGSKEPSLDQQTIPNETYIELQTTSALRQQTNESALSVSSHRDNQDQDKANPKIPSSQGVIPGGAGLSIQSSVLSSQTEPISTSTSSEEQSTRHFTSPGGDGAQEAEAVLYQHSLPSMDDSGVDSEISSQLSRDTSCGSEGFTESLSPDVPSRGDIGQQMLGESDRGTPDGSVEGSMTLEDDPQEPLASDETLVSEGSESLKDSSNADSCPPVERTGGASAADETVKGHTRENDERSELLAAGSDRVCGNDSLRSQSSSLETSASGLGSTQHAQQKGKSWAAKLFPVCKFVIDAITKTEKPF